MKDLDPGQQRELDSLLSRRTSWVRFSLPVRIVLALALSAYGGLLTALAGAFIFHGPWLVWAIAGACLVSVALIGHVVAPERMARAIVRSGFPTAAAMKRGDAAWQRSGQANVPPRDPR